MFITLFIDALAFSLVSTLVGVAVGLRLAKWLFGFKPIWQVSVSIFFVCWLTTGVTNLFVRVIISPQAATTAGFLIGIFGAMVLCLVIKGMLQKSKRQF